ncbi:mannose-6-phosphate isomerase [Streptomyces sp. A7024]|uniref:Mannose-6-phosphate isomerase n=1 Tax=Streptomyces coryli TaxID=1128680 RepID=A0A6G4UAZ4_9ACTN|nr:SIS domain-containing protein [Streptomyces coryli]NGN69399.1 mannose-6-phosphate isomerase [Streptomyces coryli]
MLDETVLDDPRALAAADPREFLRGTAEAGARVRTAARAAREAGIDELNPDGRPRALFVAGPGPATYCIADLLAALTGGACPVTAIEPTGTDSSPAELRWALPGWAGPLDLLIIATGYGREPGLEALVEQAYRRGCALAAVAPRSATISQTVADLRGFPVPLIPLGGQDGDYEPPGSLWALLTPLLQLTDRLGLVDAPAATLDKVADRLDAVAERCGPAIETYTNPAKTLAVELAESLPLLWADGPVAAAAGRHFATALGAIPGRPALAAPLPHALQTHAALLAGEFGGPGGDPDDFFRDRVDEPEALRARVVLLRQGELGGQSPTRAARELINSRGAPVSELAPAEGSPLEAAAELIATGDFTSVYLALASSLQT